MESCTRCLSSIGQGRIVMKGYKCFVVILFNGTKGALNLA